LAFTAGLVQFYHSLGACFCLD